ncbi:MAG TPA: CBS domain-containing protein [Longimicrobiaceae bacterium]|nr:CBS domain-containing protein [Longimicrobiaceae bacterium]
MSDPTEKLQRIASLLHDGGVPGRVTVRELLSWFGAPRRGQGRARRVRSALAAAGLTTRPDFEGAFIDSEISFALTPLPAEAARARPSSADAEATKESDAEIADRFGSVSVADAAEDPHLLSGGLADPTYRIGKLAAANRAPVTIAPDASLHEAVTLMMLHGFSQLPVMQGERTVKGMISWQSIGSRLALGTGGEAVRDYMETAAEISADASLFAAIRTIVDRQYVLVRDSEKKISGIVTTTDVSLRFQQLAEPFLLLGEIENHIRRLIDGKFSLEDVQAFRDPNDAARDVQSVADLTFGEYLRLLENPTMWEKIAIQVDRASFVDQLDRVREIRNDVMHFDPDGVLDDELATLRRFVKFLQTLQTIGVG